MHSIIFYLLAAGAGVLIAWFITREPELRATRLSLFVFLPVAMVLFVYFLQDGRESSPIAGIGKLMCFLAVLAFLILLLAPKIAHLCGVGLSNFLDNYDWTPAEEEIALRPIRRLIDKDQYIEARDELDKLLKKHKPTYEAVLIKAKLLHHFGSVPETVNALLSLIELCNSTAQQLAVMELLALLEEYHQDPPKPLACGIRNIEIHHELVLFQTVGPTASLHKEIPPGTYEVNEIFYCNRRWLKLVGEDWGNAAMCWEAILGSHRPSATPSKSGFFRQIARMHQAITIAIKGKPRRQLLPEAQQLLKEASQFIRHDDWQSALPLLQKASVCDPDCFEIAHRWALAVRHTASDAKTADAVNQVLQQSQWTESEQHMLNQLRKPLVE